MTGYQYREKEEEVKLHEVKAGEAPPVEIKVADPEQSATAVARTTSTEENSKSALPPVEPGGETPPSLGPRYDILGLVGTGGMGTVWKVHDKELDEDFAIKVLKPELVTDETALKRFQKEANLASELTHANIAAIFGPGEDGAGRPYIIMRYVDGESLADILKREGKLSEERAIDIFNQLCEALSHSHMKGIIHRDIKPSNIIISKTESGADLVQLVDFGIARCVYDEVTKTQALTKAVDVFGSPRYMSPEQLLGEEVTEKSDIYSLGIVLYEMLAGVTPFTEENPIKLVLQVLDSPPDLSKLPEHLIPLVERCILKQSADRPTNISQILPFIQGIHRPSAGWRLNFDELQPSLYNVCLAIFAMTCLVTLPTITTIALAGLISLLFMMTAIGINALQIASTERIRRLEFFLFINAILLLSVWAIEYSVRMQMQFLVTSPMVNQMLRQMSVLLASIPTFWLLNSNWAYLLYQKLANKLGRFNYEINGYSPNARFLNIFLTLLKPVTLAVFVVGGCLLGIKIAIVSAAQTGPIQNILGPIVFSRASLAESLLIVTVPCIANLQKLNVFKYALPKAGAIVISFCTAVILGCVSSHYYFAQTANSGFTDYLKIAARSSAYTSFGSEWIKKHLNHPSTYWGAIAALEANTLEEDAKSTVLKEVSKSNPDVNLRVAAEIKQVFPMAYNGYASLDEHYSMKRPTTIKALQQLTEPEDLSKKLKPTSLETFLLDICKIHTETYDKRNNLRWIFYTALNNKDPELIRSVISTAKQNGYQNLWSEKPSTICSIQEMTEQLNRLESAK